MYIYVYSIVILPVMFLVVFSMSEEEVSMGAGGGGCSIMVSTIALHVWDARCRLCGDCYTTIPSVVLMFIDSIIS